MCSDQKINPTMLMQHCYYFLHITHYTIFRFLTLLTLIVDSGYDPYCILCLGYAAVRPRRSWRWRSILHVEAQRNAATRCPSPHLILVILETTVFAGAVESTTGVGICITYDELVVLHQRFCPWSTHMVRW